VTAVNINTLLKLVLGFISKGGSVVVVLLNIQGMRLEMGAIECLL
jgi:hypothetical protein